LETFAQQGINIGKIQISAAVKAVLDGADDEKKFRQLQKFQEPRYLHQTVVKNNSGELEKFRDLSDALFEKTPTGELRTHYHVPLFLEKFENLQTTQNEVLEVFNFLKKNHITNHLEVETYTWDVLPENLRDDLAANIIREMQWVKKNLQ
jgi:hypothetical protein